MKGRARTDRTLGRTLATTLGMTLVEVLAVVVILGSLAAALTVSVLAQSGKAKFELAKTQIAQLVNLLQTYALEKNGLPNPGEGLHPLTLDPAATWFAEPNQIIDPWGHPFQYLVPGPDGRPFEVSTYGADNQPGGTGNNADLSSANLGTRGANP